MSQQIDFKLYLISDRKIFQTSIDLLKAVEDALKAGVRAVQLREKDLPTQDLLSMAKSFRVLTGRYRAKLFINDRVDIALCVDADGVHLGRESIPVEVVKKVSKGKLLVGCSTHSLKEAADAAEGGADFITFGPLFHTPSKLQYGEPVGLNALREAREKVSISIPVFGLGGIKTDNIKEVINSGASGISLISGILGSEDIGAAAREYLKKAGESL